MLSLVDQEGEVRENQNTEEGALQGRPGAECDLWPTDRKVTRMTTRNELERGFQALETLSRECR